MPLEASLVGTTGPACAEQLEDRWVMNYAAAVFDRNPLYFDNLDGRALPAHPAYVSHQEWEAIGALHEMIEGLTPEERERGVHSYNDTRLFSPLHSGDTISCVARVESVDRRRSGGRLSLRVDTKNTDGELVASSVTQTIFRGVGVAGSDISAEVSEAASDLDELWSSEPTRVERVEIDANAAHLFSECARDYSPIHTDISVATKAGLPGLILHGTATFAIALSSITNHEVDGDPTRVRRFGGRLGAMVRCPSTLQLEVRRHPADPERLGFELVTDNGARAIARGFVEVGA